MRHRRPSRWPIYLVAFLVAAMLHVPLLEMLHRLTQPGPSPALQPSSRQFVARMAPRLKPKPKKKQDEMPKGQIVDLPDPPEPQKPPPDAKYVSSKNQRTKKETKARHRTAKRSRKMGKQRVKKESPIQSPDATSPDPTKLQETQKEPALPRYANDVRPAPTGDLPVQRQRVTPARTPLLLPSTSQRFALANIQAESGFSAADDALLEVREEAENTALNAREFKYWFFFNRIKAKVRDNWSPADVYRRRDPTGRVFGVRDRLTILRVTLDQKGRVRRLASVKPSGAEFLDDEALRAFRAAGPFPNPPSGLFDGKGEITFEFGFLFEISSKPRFFWKR